MLIDGDRLKVVNAPIARTKLGSATAQDVTMLQIALAVEVVARTAGDAALSAALATEVTNRTNADIALQSQITELQQPRYSTELLLGGM